MYLVHYTDESGSHRTAKPHNMQALEQSLVSLYNRRIEAQAVTRYTGRTVGAVYRQDGTWNWFCETGETN